MRWSGARSRRKHLLRPRIYRPPADQECPRPSISSRRRCLRSPSSSSSSSSSSRIVVELRPVRQSIIVLVAQRRGSSRHHRRRRRRHRIVGSPRVIAVLDRHLLRSRPHRSTRSSFHGLHWRARSARLRTACFAAVATPVVGRLLVTSIKNRPAFRAGDRVLVHQIVEALAHNSGTDPLHTPFRLSAFVHPQNPAALDSEMSGPCHKLQAPSAREYRGEWHMAAPFRHDTGSHRSDPRSASLCTAACEDRYRDEIVQCLLPADRSLTLPHVLNSEVNSRGVNAVLYHAYELTHAAMRPDAQPRRSW